jgi:DNA-binding NarL/FixJ family response regulator
MGTPIRLIIADDHEIFRKGFHVLLRKNRELKIIGEAEQGRELIDLVKKLKPDIVITDIQMPIMDGVEATKKIHQQFPDIGIIALTMFNDDHLILDMLEAGAKGYVLKNTNRQELQEAVNAVYNGGSYFCNATTKKMARLIAKSKFDGFQSAQHARLTSKELQIIKLICEEHSSKQIASLLGYTTRTVENYREKIQEKIGAKNAVGVAVYAFKHNLVEP